MFGLSFSTCQLIQGPAVRTWNCVAHFANLLWYKFSYVRHPIMPRQRRRHHSRSRSRSRSPSYDRDREPKRRKIESYDSPQHKRSISPDSNEESDERAQVDAQITDVGMKEVPESESKEESASSSSEDANDGEIIEIDDDSNETSIVQKSEAADDLTEATNEKATPGKIPQNLDVSMLSDNDSEAVMESEDSSKVANKSFTSKVSESSKITPKKTLSPKQIQKKLEIEKRREEKQQEREMKKQEMLRAKEEKQKLKKEKEQQKLKEKQGQKQKELEEKQKERELKEEKKKKEREEKEQKRKEKEERSEQKRKEQEEKNKEKQKQEEKKQKAAAAFVNFFTKKNDSMTEEKKLEDNIASLTFMPFEVKSDMRLAPAVRITLTDDQKANLVSALEKQMGTLYLEELKTGRKVGKSSKTWPVEDTNDVSSDDVIIVEDINPGESIEEQAKINDKVRAKFLKFSDNRRPAYFGTWRKKSKFVKPRRPLALDKDNFDYEYDSDEDWDEDADAGESLRGSDDEDKENESDNEYEVDNEFFVPHGHLSDDELNDEEDKVSPVAHEAKLKLLEMEFEEEMQSKTQKIKPRVIGCIWYNRDGSNVDSAIHEFLKPLAIISNGPVIIKKRNECIVQTPVRRSIRPSKPLSTELIPEFLKFIHGNTNNHKMIINEFLGSLNIKNIQITVSKASLTKQLKNFADWIRCPDEGRLHNKFCWYVRENVKEQYNVELVIPSK